MKVFIVHAEVSYEFGSVIGVFGNEEDAKAHAQARLGDFDHVIVTRWNVGGTEELDETFRISRD